MPLHPTRRLIEQRCKDLCDRLGLAQVYVTQVVGRRRHYLAGHGCPLPGRPEQRSLAPHLVVFWHGNLTDAARESFEADLKGLTDSLEKQVALCESNEQQKLLNENSQAIQTQTRISQSDGDNR